MLLIDDNADKAYFLKRNICKRHPETTVLSFRTLAAALKDAATLEVDLIVTNGRVAHGDGISAIARLHRLQPNVPIMVITLRPDLEARVKEAGAAYFFDEAEEEKIYASISEVLT